jgi:acyl carrier protein
MNFANPDKPSTKLRHWIIESGSGIDDGSLHPDTNLLKDGYIDSLGLLGLVLFVEQLRGAPISEEDMSAQSFSSLRQIAKTFFAEGDDEMNVRSEDGAVPAMSADYA